MFVGRKAQEWREWSISWIKSPKINVESLLSLQAIVPPFSSSLHEIYSSMTMCPMLVTCLQGWNEISTRKIAVWCAPVKRTRSFNCLLSDVRCPPKEKSFPGECIAREEHSSMNFVNKGLQLRTRRERPTLSLGLNFSLVIGISSLFFPSFKRNFSTLWKHTEQFCIF